MPLTARWHDVQVVVQGLGDAAAREAQSCEVLSATMLGCSLCRPACGNFERMDGV